MANKTDKLIDEISTLTALELSELVKALEEKFGVTAMAPVAAAAPAQLVEAKRGRAKLMPPNKLPLM